MFSWIIFFFLWHLRSFSGSCLCTLFLIDSDSFSTENTTFLLLDLFFDCSLSFWRFLIIKRRCKVDINISIDDANGIIRCLGINFENINIELLIKSGNRNCIAFMQTCKISQLILKYSLGIACFDEFSSVWSKFNHVLCFCTLSFHVGNQSYWSWWPLFWEFKHFEHPIWYVADTF